MGAGFTLSALPEFAPGECVLFTKRCIWLVSSKSSPSYRISPSLPPLFDLGAYVTDQRILLFAQILRVFNQQFSIWYKPHGEDDVVQEIRVFEGRFPYVEILSEAPVKSWLRSPECRIRLYMHDALEFQRALVLK